MCNTTGVIFTALHLERQEVEKKRILEVGALDVNGSVRPLLERFQPVEYIGVDLIAGKGVDRICRIEDLEAEFGKESVDVVIASEVLEHVLDWRRAVTNIKRVCRPGGIVLITTRSPGFKYHGYPHDFWRYDVDDMRRIFSDFQIERIETDSSAPGVFFKAKKPPDFAENELVDHPLYSVLVGKKLSDYDALKLDSLSRRVFAQRKIRKKIVHIVQRILRLK